MILYVSSSVFLTQIDHFATVFVWLGGARKRATKGYAPMAHELIPLKILKI